MARVLVVEDDPNQRLLYQVELQQVGYDIVTAKDGREALDLIEHVELDLVVMDIQMPGMDGMDAMMRMLARDHKLPFVLNTAYASYKSSFRTRSGDACVLKSSDLTELKQAIKKVLPQSAAGRAQRPELGKSQLEKLESVGSEGKKGRSE